MRLDDLRTGITVVTGTDTDVGKTVATAALVAWLQGRGARPLVCKAAQTGMAPGEPGDLAQVARLTGLGEDDLVEFSRLPEPLAPTTAAARAGVSVPPVAELARRVVDLARERECVLVEGAGGILVGLDGEGATLLDLVEELVRLGASPRVVVVTRSVLGTLNHTALTVQAIRARVDLPVGVVVGAWPREPDLAERCNLEELPDIAPLLGVLPAGIGESPEAVRGALSDAS